MAKRIPSIHSRSDEDRAHHQNRGVSRSALARALDPISGYSDAYEDAWTGLEGAVTTEEDTYDMGGGPMDLTRRNRGVEWEPTEYEQEQSRFRRDAVLDALKDSFSEDD